MTDQIPRFTRGWRRVPRPSGGGMFGVQCFVPVDRILTIEPHQEGAGWTAVMDFKDAEGRLVVVDDIDHALVRALTGDDQPVLDRPMFAMQPGDDLQPGQARVWRRRVA